MKMLIVNADDFGASEGINRGIVESHIRGIVTSASLMVDMPNAREAVRMTRDASGLGLGLHVVLTEEGGTYLVDPEDPASCRAAIARQFSVFEDLAACAPTHLDAHHNVYRDPRLTPHFLRAAAERKIPLREHSAVIYFPEYYGQWDGETHLEQISVESLRVMLEFRIGDGMTELGCHPGYVDPHFQSPYSWEREAEVATLSDPSLPEFLKELEIVLTNYRELGEKAMPREEQ
jgi:predicted glycoside hydrolase/deacetylase ChbG (UPF0249 family)